MPEIGFTQPGWLYCLPLALLPLWQWRRRRQAWPAFAWFETDHLSIRLEWIRKWLEITFLSTLIIAQAAPFIKEQKVLRVGKGAHIVLTIDRSSSMNENFSGRYLGGSAKESKSSAARRLLLDFVSQRHEDLFAMISFSTAPIHILSLTQDHQAIQAAIRAIGLRGRGVTNIAPGLAMALEAIRARPLSGARVILLVSDGGARIDPDTQDRLRQDFQDLKVRLYWIYLRAQNSISVLRPPRRNLSETTTPEFFLHQYFQTLGVPYRVFEADNPTGLAQAIADIGRLENRPLHYFEIVPRRDLTGWGYGLTLMLGCPLLFWYAMEISRWL